MSGIKSEIKTLGIENRQEGLFLTISKNSDIKDTKSLTKIFVSENNKKYIKKVSKLICSIPSNSFILPISRK